MKDLPFILILFLIPFLFIFAILALPFFFTIIAMNKIWKWGTGEEYLIHLQYPKCKE